VQYAPAGAGDAAAAQQLKQEGAGPREPVFCTREVWRQGGGAATHVSREWAHTSQEPSTAAAVCTSWPVPPGRPAACAAAAGSPPQPPPCRTGVRVERRDFLLQAAQHGAAPLQVGRHAGQAHVAVCQRGRQRRKLGGNGGLCAWKAFWGPRHVPPAGAWRKAAAWRVLPGPCYLPTTEPINRPSP
jgi:hypothetical protein